jgi:hypothetical protein
MKLDYEEIAKDFLAPVRHFYLVVEEYEAHLDATTKRLKQLARDWRKEGVLLKNIFDGRGHAICENTLVMEDDCRDRKDEDC